MDGPIFIGGCTTETHPEMTALRFTIRRINNGYMMKYTCDSAGGISEDYYCHTLRDAFARIAEYQPKDA